MDPPPIVSAGFEDAMELGPYELGLEKYLEEAYATLETAVDIWQKVDQVLPERKYS
jgi:hypothetical protein